MHYIIGSTIEYRTFDNVVRRVVVESKEDDIKNGRPGFSGRQVHRGGTAPPGGPTSVWGYDHQITNIVVL